MDPKFTLGYPVDIYYELTPQTCGANCWTEIIAHEALHYVQKESFFEKKKPHSGAIDALVGGPGRVGKCVNCSK